MNRRGWTALLFALALAWPPGAQAQAVPEPAAPPAPRDRKDWHVDAAFTMGGMGSFNNAFPFSIGVRVAGTWKWIGGEVRIDVLPLTIYDSYDGGGEHDGPGDPWVVLGQGIRVVALPDSWVTPYGVVLAQQFFEPRDDEWLFALGPVVGLQFQWEKPVGLYLEGGVGALLDGRHAETLSGASDNGAMPFVWNFATGLNVRF